MGTICGGGGRPRNVWTLLHPPCCLLRGVVILSLLGPDSVVHPPFLLAVFTGELG